MLVTKAGYKYRAARSCAKLCALIDVETPWLETINSQKEIVKESAYFCCFA